MGIQKQLVTFGFTRKILNKKRFFGGVILAPKSAIPPKISNPVLPMTNLVFAESFFSKKWDVCTKEKTKVNAEIIDGDMRHEGLGLKKTSFNFFAKHKKYHVI